MTSPEIVAKGDAGSAGIRSGVPAAASASARTTIRRASSILKPLSPEGFGVRERRLGCATEQRGISACAGQDRFRFTGPPGFWRNAAQREPRFQQLYHPRGAERPRLIQRQMRTMCVRGL